MEEEALNFYNYNELDEYQEDEDQVLNTKKIDKKEIPLVNDDYNLNSPIMYDIIANLLKLNVTGEPLNHHVNRTTRIWKPFAANRLIFSEARDINGTYNKVFNYISDTFIYHLRGIKELVKVIDFEIDSVKEVADVFVNSLGTKSLEFSIMEILESDDLLQNLLFKILEINLLSECMVAGDKRYSIKNYDKSFHFKTLKENLIEFRTTNFRGYMSNEVIYDSLDRVFIDKNLLLMIKDILNGRFNTLLLISLNLEKKYTGTIKEVFKQILKIGDELIVTAGNDAYEYIALLEPFCINRIQNLADQTRPKIIVPNNFRIHLDNKINEASTHFKTYLKKLDDLLDNIDNPNDLTIIYGSFRLWGHPYIQYPEGLLKVKEQVRMDKPQIDKNYSKLLASDLMKSMMLRHFKRHRTWNVRDTPENRKIRGIESLLENNWPSAKDLHSLEGHWDEIDIDPILDIPEDIEDSQIFSDKTHSLDFDDILRYVERDPTNPIPTKRVLKTYLEKPRINIKDFILDVDNNGLKKEKLVIGLKAKEREMKKFGRFFTLMTWDLRLYFVISEFMIKEDFIKVFPGLTMGDGHIDLINKILDRTEGQRGHEYINITYSNHIDYSKWNNHQRDESVGQVFSIIDKCYGLKHFFRSTHNFFKKCVIYYPERPDQWGIDGPFYWEGQPGGFEGIRQKGWSLVGILCLLRESKYRNTKVELLAQGDNQVVFTNYTLNGKLRDEELDNELKKVFNNNDSIMKRIKTASVKMGLIINEDETVQSAGFTIYGKTPIFKGNILNLETKKVNRVSGITNDQLPTAANIMSSVNSTALTICQYDPNTRNSVYIHLIYGIIVLNTLKLWNPMGQFGELPHFFSKKSLAYWLYHDQSLGGNTGMALTRFLVRRFPDPISECLAFYKYMKDNLKDKELQNAFLVMGNPIKKRFSILAFNKLLEDPTSLNIHKGSNIATVIKNQVKKSLINYSDNIKNELLKNSLNKVLEQEEYLVEFLYSVRPVFPRFISDFKQASICGYIDGVVGLVQNAKTIRSMFSHEFEGKIRQQVTRWEREQWSNVLNKVAMRELINWSCSSSHADYLRKSTWELDILGETVPHPYEYQSKIILRVGEYVKSGRKDLITCIVPKKISLSLYDHGGNRPYLGSNTKESSSALQPWEKDLTNPIFRKASELRRGINWMIDPKSRLAASIYHNLEYVTNVNLINELSTLKKRRTGTALHRYKTSRQDNGGYCNITPNVLSWFIVTSDYMTDLSDTNYDFMYQASLIYTETVGAHILTNPHNLSSFGLGISCKDCIRELKDFTLESGSIYQPSRINKTFWLSKIHKTGIESEDSVLDSFLPTTDEVMRNTSYSVGLHQGIASTIKLDRINDNMMLSDIYSVGVMMKMNGNDWFNGLSRGVLISAGFTVLNSASFMNNNYHMQMIKNRAYSVIKKLSEDPYFYPILRLNNLSEWLLDNSNYVPPDYPPNASNISRAFAAYSFDKIQVLLTTKRDWIPQIYKKLIIYNDFDNDDFKLMLLIGLKVLNFVDSDMGNNTRKKNLKNLFAVYNDFKNNRDSEDLKQTLLEELLTEGNFIQISSAELKIPVEKMSAGDPIVRKQREIYKDKPGYELQYVPFDEHVTNSNKANSIESPFISGLRAYRCATGAHYKMNDILNWLNIAPDIAVVGGDGSGGMSSLVLRKYESCQVIFNSLMEYKDINLRGGQPGKPQAIMKLTESYRERCINLDNCWMEPSDLTTKECWNNFKTLLTRFGGTKNPADLMILDMEARTLENYINIYQHFVGFLKEGFVRKGGVTVTKCYTGMVEEIYEIIKVLSDNCDIIMVNGRYSSTFTTEVYIIISIGRKLTNLALLKRRPDVESLNFSLRTETSEYQRALNLDIASDYNSIPLVLRENYESYLIDYMLTLKIPAGLGLLITTLIVNGNYNLGLNYLFYYAGVIYGTDQDLVSSDQRLKKIICFLCSTLYYRAFTDKIEKSFKRANKLNNDVIRIVNDKERLVFLIKDIYWNTDEYYKDIGPIRDNSYINILLRSLLGCKYTVLYREDDLNINIKRYRFNHNINEILM